MHTRNLNMVKTSISHSLRIDEVKVPNSAGIIGMTLCPGNILGAMQGKAAIPAPWLEELELKHVIEEIAVDLFVQNEALRKYK